MHRNDSKILTYVVLVQALINKGKNIMYKKISIIIFVIFLSVENTFPQHFFSTSIPMRDGKYLAADVYSPDTTKAFPVILIKTPYNKDRYQTHGLPLTTDDYAITIVDWRGFHGSTDAAIDTPDYGRDGYDCIEWIAQQGWSNGKIGMWGISAVGIVQYQTAKEHPPHLVCSVPIFANYKQQYQRYYTGGVLRKTYLERLAMLGYKVEPILAHPIYDAFWKYTELVTTYPQEIDVPMLLMAGWYDHHSYSDGIFCIFNELRSLGGINGREHHKLIIGPWHHNHIGESVQGQLEYPNAAGTTETEALNFFDYWLRDIPNGYDNLPYVRYYQMGTNEWLNNETYPLDNVTPTFIYLHPAGILSEANPVDACPSDSFYYDPRNPSPTIGGVEISYLLVHGPYNQRWLVESRDDVVVFSTEVLDKDLVVAGEVKVSYMFPQIAVILILAYASVMFIQMAGPCWSWMEYDACVSATPLNRRR
jgi:predicted acyl esterase